MVSLGGLAIRGRGFCAYRAFAHRQKPIHKSLWLQDDRFVINLFRCRHQVLLMALVVQVLALVVQVLALVVLLVVLVVVRL